MNLESQVVSLELSKKLKELGVEQKSIFYWIEKNTPTVNLPALSLSFKISEYNDGSYKFCSDELGTHFLKPNHEKYSIYSAFTVAELGEILKKTIKDFPYGSHIGLYQISIGYENEGINKGSWECRVDERNIGTQFIRTASTMPDAMALMLIHLTS